MRFTKLKTLLAVTLLIATTPTLTSATQIVRFNIEYFNSDATPLVENHVLDVELFDDVTPLTVTNFVNYIDSGKYNKSFFTRSIAGFIIQAGGFTFIPTLAGDFLRPIEEGTGLEEVDIESTSPVQNEYELTTTTNVRGTLAMAKIGFDPNSATSEWFINLADNRANLDNQNGGFTVFGKIIDNGITFADTISTLPIHGFAGTAINSAFSALPVTGYLLGDPIYQENLALISSTNSAIIRPILRFTPAETVFPLDVVDGSATSSSQTITFTNTGNENLTVISITNTSPVEFSITSNNCTSTLLEPITVTPASSCSIVMDFTATATGEVMGGIDVDYDSPSSSYNVSLPLTAEGVNSAADFVVDDIDLAASATEDVFLGFVDIGTTESQTLTLRNKGGTALTIATISLTNTGEYSVDNAGCIAGTVLSLDESCELVISFAHTRTVADNADSVLTITSDANNLVVQMRAFSVDPVTEVPASVDFGSIVVNQSDTKSITIKNTGTGLVLNNFVISGTDTNLFSFTTNCPADGLLRPAVSCQIFVTFKPDSDGNKTASIAINSNDSTSPTSVPLTGRGVLLTVPTLNASESNINFTDTDAIAGDTSNHTITLDNIGIDTVTISSISITNDNGNVFSVDNIDCMNGSILSTNSCDLIVGFTPDTGLNFSANLIIESDFGTLDIPLSGTGLAPVISASVEDVFVGTSQINGLAVEQRLTIVNFGNETLEVSDVSITGLNSTEFSRKLLCTSATQITLAPGFQCVIEVILSGQSIGSKVASLVLTTNDPRYPTFTINLSGSTDKDVDGIPSSIEQQASNNGDGNNDGIADEIQNNTASFITGSDVKVTMFSENASLLLNTGLISDIRPATALLNVTKLDPIPEQFPADVDFDLGVYSYTIKVIGDLPADTERVFVNVGVYLPLDVNVDKFYRFGPTPFFAEPQLYDFTYSSTTGLGARLIGPVTILSPSGAAITRNLVIITYVDGGLGDDDLARNGFINVSAGGFSSAPPVVQGSDSAGSISAYYLLMLALLLSIARVKQSARLIDQS